MSKRIPVNRHKARKFANRHRKGALHQLRSRKRRPGFMIQGIFVIYDLKVEDHREPDHARPF